jgi:c-di-GMP-binding flagellar brake protein YcgR
MLERRKYPRVEISFPVECDLIQEKSYFYTVSRDLSVAGLKIITNRFLPKNDILKVNINLIDKVLDIHARVAWCVQTRSPESYWAGLEFIDTNERDRRDLSQFLNSINHA